MPRWTPEQITREAAQDIQARIGQNYQTVQLHRWLQQAWETLWEEYDWRETLRTDYATVSSGSDVLVLPSKYSKLAGFYKDGDGRRWWGCWGGWDGAKHRLDELFDGGPSGGWRQSGCGIYHATSTGDAAVLQQPPSVLTAPTVAEHLSLVSSNAGDTGGGAACLFVDGEDANGVPANETISLTGTTPVNSSNSYSRINSLSTGMNNKAGTWTVSGVTSTEVYATLLPPDAQSIYATYHLAGKPSADQVVYFVAKLRPPQILNLVHGTPLMELCANGLKWDICGRAMLEKREQQMAQTYMSLRNSEIAQVKQNMSNRQPPSMILQRW